MLPAVQVKLPDSLTAASAGSWAFLRGTGSLFGVAVPGAVFNVRFASLLSTIPSEKARTALADGQAYQHATAYFINRHPTAKDEIIAAFTDSLRSVWIVFAAVAGVGFLLTWFERQHKMRKVLDTQYGLKPKKAASTTTTPGETPASTPPTSMPGSEIFPPPATVDREDPFLSEQERRRKRRERQREMERVDSSCDIEMERREREREMV
jgi:hypothetical protein